MEMKLEEICKNWIHQFEASLKQYFPDILEAFIEYYKEDYREEITRRLSNLRYRYVLCYDAYYNTKCYIKNEETSGLVRYLKQVNHILNTMIRRGRSNSVLLSKETLLCQVEEKHRRDRIFELYRGYFEVPTIAMGYGEPESKETGIIFPIYFLNQDVIIHEFNHFISTPETEKINIFPNDIVDELLNEITSQDILEILKRKGIQILPYHIEINQFYTKNIELIRPFYEEFKDYIKECLVTQDIRILEEKLGKTYLDTYFALIEKLCQKEKVSESDKKRLAFLCLFMKEHLKKEKEHGRI